MAGLTAIDESRTSNVAHSTTCRLKTPLPWLRLHVLDIPKNALKLGYSLARKLAFDELVAFGLSILIRLAFQRSIQFLVIWSAEYLLFVS